MCENGFKPLSHIVLRQFFCNTPEKLNMFKLIVIFRKIRVRACFYNNYTIFRINIYPLTVNTDSHKFFGVFIRYPPLIAITYGIIRVIVCSGFRVFFVDIHTVLYPFFWKYLFSGIFASLRYVIAIRYSHARGNMPEFKKIMRAKHAAAITADA